MDPNPSNFPILSYIMAKLPSIGPNRSSTDGVDIEQPPLPPPQPQEPHFDLTERMPRLTDPNVVSVMQLAVSEVAQTRSVLKTLGIRPDHEIVDIAKMKLAEINAKLSKHHDEDESVSSPPGSPDEWRKVAEKEREEYKSLISLDELHEAYEKMLKEAEEKLERIYEAAVAGGDVATAENVIDEKGSGVEEEVNEEVVMILKEALWKDVEKVDLSRRMLKFLPEAFGKIRSLIVLNLSTNQLRVIPDSIAGLENVEELHLSSNLLESLPDSIGLLVRLKILDVSGNKLTALPDSISNCRSLVELDASFNELTYLPTNIGYELVNVKRLSVPFNKLRSVPNSIGAMMSMRVLHLHFNQLHGLPRSIGNLTDLEILNLSSNFSDLTQLPDTISDLTNLKELDLSNNQIHELPDTFGRLDNLSKLNLDQNPLVIPPKEVVDGGAKAVKAFMIKRQLDIQKAEERQRMEDEEEQTLTSLLTRSTSWLTSAVSSVSGTVAEYLGGERKLEPNHYLNQQF